MDPNASLWSNIAVNTSCVWLEASDAGSIDLQKAILDSLGLFLVAQFYPICSSHPEFSLLPVNGPQCIRCSLSTSWCRHCIDCFIGNSAQAELLSLYNHLTLYFRVRPKALLLLTHICWPDVCIVWVEILVLFDSPRTFLNCQKYKRQRPHKRHFLRLIPSKGWRLHNHLEWAARLRVIQKA